MINEFIMIKNVEHLNEMYFIISIEVGEVAQAVKAGQFFQIKPAYNSSTMLRKPISVYDVNGTDVKLMIKNLGKGTNQLATLKTGDMLDVIGPLGNGFPLLYNKKAILVSGGIGYPPLFFLEKKLREQNCKIYWLHGGQTVDDIFPADEMWTDDGSLGNRGYVTKGLDGYLVKQKSDVIYACGPQPMLKACHKIAEEHKVPLYVSLEEYMACGIGVCHGCAVAVKPSGSEGYTYKNVCKDGPVFKSDEIVWD
jgi:dihydroorotate dehydrogenase electron transfer subunit